MKSQNPMLTLPDGFVAQIEQVTDFQIDELILLTSQRFNQLRPDREGVFLTLPRDLTQRRKELELITKLLLLDTPPVICEK